MTWKEVLTPIKESDYFKKLWHTVKETYQKEVCFPPKSEIFRALELTPFEDVRVVIIGQDPYHNVGQANGLCFSVSEGMPAPPSLVNIFKELKGDIGVERKHTDLSDWAQQGVLLLNAVLTVKAHQAASHRDLGWEKFTDYIIQQISQKKEGVVFVLWGSYAQKKRNLIDISKHKIVAAPHPSPLSAYRGFFGSKPFSHINEYLISRGQPAIQWG